MKRIYTTIIFACIITAFGLAAKAQNYCNSFCATGIVYGVQDTSSRVVNIFFNDSSTTFISYPYILGMVNNQGDTVAKGFLEFFGQYGGTTTGYTVQPYNGFINANFIGIIVFLYINNTTFKTDTCLLSYPCLTTGINTADAYPSYIIYPNPSNGQLNISHSVSNNNYLSIYSSIGEIVYSSSYGLSTEIDISQYPRGIYFLKITEGEQIRFEKIVLQ